MEKIFEGWRKHNSKALTEAKPDDPESIPLSTSDGPVFPKPKPRAADPDAIPLGGSGAVSGDLSPDARKQAEKALKAAGIDTPLDRLQYFGEISGNNVRIEIPVETRVLDPKKMTYRLWVQTTEGLACIELKNGRANFILPDSLDIGPSGALWEPDKLAQHLSELKEDWFDQSDPANRRLITSLDNAHLAAMDALKFADQAELLAASGDLAKGRFARLWDNLQKSYKYVRNYFSLSRKNQREVFRLDKLYKYLGDTTQDYREQGQWNLIGQEYGEAGKEAQLARYNPRLRAHVEADLAMEDQFLKFNEEARQTWIAGEEAKIGRLKDDLNRLEGTQGLLNKAHRWPSLRPVDDLVKDGPVSLETLALPDQETGECDRFCEKAKKKLAELKQEAKFLSQEIDIREEWLVEVKKMKLKPATRGRKAWEIVKRFFSSFSDTFIRIFKWTARKLAFFAHPALIAVGIAATVVVTYDVYKDWKIYTSRLEEVVGAGANRLMLFLAYLSEEDPTGFLRDLITGFFLETAYSATRKRPEDRNVLEQAVALSMMDYMVRRRSDSAKQKDEEAEEETERMKNLFRRAATDHLNPKPPPDDPPTPYPIGDLLETYIPGKSLKIVLG